MIRGLRLCLVLIVAGGCRAGEPGRMGRIEVAPDGKGFQVAGGGGRFVPWGFNYDRDRDGRLLEDYWEREWETVAGDFREMQALGANVVRVHLQFGRFMRSATEADAGNLARLRKLLRLAEEHGLRLDLTGLGCYHKRDVPAWYDALGEAARWDAQAAFWKSVAGACAGSPAVFCHDLMNEPVAPAGRQAEWLGPPLGDKHYVQRIALDQAGRERWRIAADWINRLVAAIREVDGRALVTVGMVDWSLERPGLTSGFVPAKVAERLDFVAVHLYPKSGRIEEDLATLAGFAAVGKPLVVEEIFPLGCSVAELRGFMAGARERGLVSGWIGFYWGETPEELAAPDDEGIADPQERFRRAVGREMTRGWLELFRGGVP